MKSINYVIVEIDDLYINTKDGIIINDSIENVENINRIPTVISAPDFTILKTGDKLVVHHNIFRKKYNNKGEQLMSAFWIEDNKYFIPFTEIFMYKRDSEWKCLNPFCFVEPIKQVQKIEGFRLIDNLHKGTIQHKGIVGYSNEELKNKGINKGDTILFSRNSEYEFEIEGRLYYKMMTKDILLKIDDRII